MRAKAPEINLAQAFSFPKHRPQMTKGERGSHLAARKKGGSYRAIREVAVSSRLHSRRPSAAQKKLAGSLRA